MLDTPLFAVALVLYVSLLIVLLCCLLVSRYVLVASHNSEQRASSLYFFFTFAFACGASLRRDVGACTVLTT